MVYALLAHVQDRPGVHYFLGLYPSEETALNAKKDYEKTFGKNGYFVNEFTTDGRLMRVNIKD